VKQEQQAIDAQYEKKRKGAEVAQKMSVQSTFCHLNIFELTIPVLGITAHNQPSRINPA
jgi:hypothetical protein